LLPLCSAQGFYRRGEAAATLSSAGWWKMARRWNFCAEAPLGERRPHFRETIGGRSMHGIIYLVGLIVVVMAVLSFLGL
jgi:hypothetical protein